MKWTIRNDSSRPEAEVVEAVRFAVVHSPEIERSLFIRVRDGRGASSGHAGSRLNGHRIPKLAGRACHYVSAEASGEPDDFWPRAGFSGHARGEATVPFRFRGQTMAAYEAGLRRVGRWPLVLTNGWQDDLLHTVAHEMWHVLQFDRGRASFSEVDCEVNAERVLAAWQARAAG